MPAWGSYPNPLSDTFRWSAMCGRNFMIVSAVRGLARVDWVVVGRLGLFVSDWDPIQCRPGFTISRSYGFLRGLRSNGPFESESSDYNPGRLAFATRLDFAPVRQFFGRGRDLPPRIPSCGLSPSRFRPVESDTDAISLGSPAFSSVYRVYIQNEANDLVTNVPR